MNFLSYIIYYNAVPVLLIINNMNCLSPYTYSTFNVRPLTDFVSGNIPYSPFRLNPEIDPYTNGQKIFGMMSPPFFNIDDANSEANKAYSCSIMPCLDDDNMVVCACNFNTGNVVSFKNKCDVLKHNCRFDTEFRIILNEICPWEFQSRRNNKEFKIDYNNPKYYN